MKKIKRLLGLYIINHFLSMTRCFKVKAAILRNIGVEIGENSKIVGPIYFGNNVKLKIGNNCWINSNFRIEGNGNVMIGNNCDIAPQVTFLTGTHEVGLYDRRAGKGKTGKIHINHGTWIGAGCMILPNVIIGRMCVLAAGSIVTKNISDNTLAAGIPACEKKILPYKVEY